MIDEVEIRLTGTRRGHFLQELFTNSIHFPLANIILESILAGPAIYMAKFDFYFILISSIVQAHFLAKWKFNNTPSPLLGNLIGPSVYTIIEISLEGLEFFESPNHIAYWFFSLTIGLLQQLQIKNDSRFNNILILLENLIRTSILLAMYWIFETRTTPKYSTFSIFLEDKSHQFIALIIPLLGLVVGFENLNSHRFLTTLRTTARQLRRYSSWLLGDTILSRAISDNAALHLKRQHRAIIFMDIRDFTAWSETREPEEIVGMLNAYFETAEEVFRKVEIIKVKHTADEIMAVMADPDAASLAGRNLAQATRQFLTGYGLSAGIGIHYGEVVEGLVGSAEVKIYDIIGDAVNTCERICSHAYGHEVLVTKEFNKALTTQPDITSSRTITVKGKKEDLQVYSISID